MERFAIPEDDASPYAPFLTFAESHIKAFHSDLTLSADVLRLSKIGWQL